MNRGIRDTFDLLSPSAEQRARIYRAVVGRRAPAARGPRFTARLACTLAACLVLTAAGTLLWKRPDSRANLPLAGTAGTQRVSQTDGPIESSAPTAAAEKKTAVGFILTAYRAEGEAAQLGADFMADAEELVLQPDVKVLLAKYSPLMSSVPGFPFTVGVIGPDGEVDAIGVSADGGNLLDWNRTTGVVSSLGKSTEIGVGGTFYWAPDYSAAAADVKRITVTVEAVSQNEVVGRQSIIITQEEPGYFYATVGEMEVL